MTTSISVSVYLYDARAQLWADAWELDRLLGVDRLRDMRRAAQVHRDPAMRQRIFLEYLEVERRRRHTLRRLRRRGQLRAFLDHLCIQEPDWTLLRARWLLGHFSGVARGGGDDDDGEVAEDALSN